jgi:hypothetical protein
VLSEAVGRLSVNDFLLSLAVAMTVEMLSVLIRAGMDLSLVTRLLFHFVSSTGFSHRFFYADSVLGVFVLSDLTPPERVNLSLGSTLLLSAVEFEIHQLHRSCMHSTFNKWQISNLVSSLAFFGYCTGFMGVSIFTQKIDKSQNQC